MHKRALGRSGLAIAPLVFGGNVFGWTADEATSFRLLDAFVDHGFDAVDTADVYSAFAPGNAGGESETIIGKWFAQSGKRDKVTLFTKVAKWERHPGLKAANIAAAVEGSLKRLQTDRIDLYFAHEDDASTPLEETLEAFGKLVTAGKVRAIGASNYEPERVNEALLVSADRGLPRYEVLQPEYNLYDRAEFEAKFAELAELRTLGAVTYFSLASGFLTGKYRSKADMAGKSRGGRVEKYLGDRGLRILDALDQAGKATGATPAQVSLSWLVSRPGVTAPIASATSVEQLTDILKAATLTLPPDVLTALDTASAP